VSTPTEQIDALLRTTLEACRCNVVHHTHDYLMALESPGMVAFTKLVTVEILIESQPATSTETRLHFIIKNEELPIRTDNHCRLVSERLSQILQDSNQLLTLSNVTG
jgi:hypothetical protein